MFSGMLAIQGLEHFLVAECKIHCVQIEPNTKNQKHKKEATKQHLWEDLGSAQKLFFYLAVGVWLRLGLPFGQSVCKLNRKSQTKKQLSVVLLVFGLVSVLY